VLDRLPATLELAFAALVLAVVVAVPLGIIAALNRGRLADVLAMAFAVVGQATPYFWMGIMLILVVSVELGWLPTSGRGTWAHLILPAITLGTHFAASLARLTRIGDLNLDGAVTISDFIDLASNFNKAGTWQEGDLNYDGFVTISDFIDLASNFNQSVSGEAMPISESDAAMLAQFAAERRSAYVRVQNLKLDRRLEQVLAFSGRGE